ncbi:MAG: fused MFS/spermidine synthase [Candidatus Doudnabacteria bacterium]|nr:fused MFS/spermidine synthase [Candidatus Doudnabacteria bacterium]
MALLSSKKTLLLISFITGVCVVGMEITASRLLAPYFGISIFIWSNIIGVVLAALALGYYLGGRLAEKRPSLSLLLDLVLGTGLFFLLVPWITPLLARLINPAVFPADSFLSALVWSSLLVALFILALPLTVLGMVSPMLIKIYSFQETRVGQIAGSLFALSTLGSLVGSFLPTLWLIPALGTRLTIVVFALLLIFLGLIGSSFKKLAFGLFLTAVELILLFGLPVSASANKDIIYQTESIYQNIRVKQDQSGRRYMIFNEGLGFESIYDPNSALTGTFYDYFSILPYLIPEKKINVLVIGFAGGTIPRQLNYFFADKVAIDAVEIDPKVVKIAEDYFDSDQLPINIYQEDGRQFLERTAKQYELIIVDAFQNEFYIPWTLTTREFWQLVDRRLSRQGILAMNLNGGQTDSDLLKFVTNTQASVFDKVYVTATASSAANFMITASQSQIDFNSEKKVDPQLQGLFEEVKNQISLVSFNSHLKLITDDWAPIERMTNLSLKGLKIDWQ